MSPRSTQGVTLLEVLIAVVVLSVFLVGLAPMLAGSIVLRKQNSLVSEATQLAQLELEDIRRYWSALPRIGSNSIPLNFNLGQIPLFGEVSSTCAPMVAVLNPISPAFTNPEAVAANNTNVRNYAILEDLDSEAGTSCNVKSASSSTNSAKKIRFVAQIFYSQAPTSNCDANPTSFNRSADSSTYGSVATNPTLICIRRVVVRVYQAAPSQTCTYAAPVNCLPSAPSTQTSRPGFGTSTRDLNFSAPLVTLVADIMDPKL